MSHTDRLNTTEIYNLLLYVNPVEAILKKTKENICDLIFRNEVLIIFHLVSKASACKAEWAALVLSSFSCELGQNLKEETSWVI